MNLRCLLCLLDCCGCDINMTFRPQTFPPYWFGGVTDWYQSFDYSELVISPKEKLQTIVSKAGKIL
jgi:hypothetical protein